MSRTGLILLVENEAHDIFFMRRAFRAAGFRNRLRALQDGAEAIDYLSGRGEYVDRLRYPLPSLLVTDIKMPKVDGFELLGWLQSRPDFVALPRIVISSSCHEIDLKRCLELGAAAYYTKPGSHKQRVSMVRQWLRIWTASQQSILLSRTS
jgi:CheY-like chemotaxis protein